jgi:glycosyltransferase involved in cell wall biosynthesis
MNCFNGETYLEESIKSVLNQTYKNWELIFWDNQSTDSSAEIFKSYNDKRFKYFYAKEHTSLYKGRNLAIEKAHGDFIAFLDTDDLWDKEKLNLQIPYFNNSKVGVVFGNFWLIKENEKKKKLYINKKLPRGNIYNKIINYYSVGILTTVIRKKIYLELKKKFDERFSIVGDFDLFLRLSKICLFESIQRPLASYRLHGKNLSTQNREKGIEEIEIWLQENQSHLNQTQTQNLQKSIDFRKFLNCKINGKYKECIDILLHSKISPFNVKNIIIFFTPIIILRKLLWFYQD